MITLWVTFFDRAFACAAVNAAGPAGLAVAVDAKEPLTGASATLPTNARVATPDTSTRRFTRIFSALPKSLRTD